MPKIEMGKAYQTCLKRLAARVIAVNVKADKPVVVVITDTTGLEFVQDFYEDGKVYNNCNSDFDLVPAPTIVYANLFASGVAYWYGTEERAKEVAKRQDDIAAIAVPITLPEQL